MKSHLLLIFAVLMSHASVCFGDCKPGQIEVKSPEGNECVRAPKDSKPEQAKPETKATEPTAAADTKNPAQASEPKTSSTEPTPKSPSSSITPGLSQADVIRRNKYADELAREREWNRRKDRESLDIRMNAFQGSHSDQRVRVSLQNSRAPLEPHVVHEYQDQYGIWEVVRGDKNSLYELMTSDPNVMWRDSSGNWYNYQAQVFASAPTTNNVSNYDGSEGSPDRSLFSQNENAGSKKQNELVNEPFAGDSTYQSFMGNINASIRNSANASASATGQQTEKPDSPERKLPSNITLNNLISMEINEGMREAAPMVYELNPEQKNTQDLNVAKRSLSSVTVTDKPTAAASRFSGASLTDSGVPSFYSKSLVALRGVRPSLLSIGLSISGMMLAGFLIFLYRRKKKVNDFEPTQVTSATRLHVKNKPLKKHFMEVSK